MLHVFFSLRVLFNGQHFQQATNSAARSLVYTERGYSYLFCSEEHTDPRLYRQIRFPLDIPSITCTVGCSATYELSCLILGSLVEVEGSRTTLNQIASRYGFHIDWDSISSKKKVTKREEWPGGYNMKFDVTGCRFAVDNCINREHGFFVAIEKQDQVVAEVEDQVVAEVVAGGCIYDTGRGGEYEVEAVCSNAKGAGAFALEALLVYAKKHHIRRVVLDAADDGSGNLVKYASSKPHVLFIAFYCHQHCIKITCNGSVDGTKNSISTSPMTATSTM